MHIDRILGGLVAVVRCDSQTSVGAGHRAGLAGRTETRRASRRAAIALDAYRSALGALSGRASGYVAPGSPAQ
jgi:hypothetical protein